MPQSKTVSAIRSKLAGTKKAYATATKTRRLANPTMKAAPKLTAAQAVSAAQKKVKVDAFQKARLKARSAARKTTAAPRMTTKQKVQAAIKKVR